MRKSTANPPSQCKWRTGFHLCLDQHLPCLIPQVQHASLQKSPNKVPSKILLCLYNLYLSSCEKYVIWLVFYHAIQLQLTCKALIFEPGAINADSSSSLFYKMYRIWVGRRKGASHVSWSKEILPQTRYIDLSRPLTSPLMKSPPWIMKSLIIRWKEQPL